MGSIDWAGCKFQNAQTAHIGQYGLEKLLDACTQSLKFEHSGPPA